MEPHFARAAVVVAPVRTGGGMRMKVLEAMAYGKPVVTSSRGIEGLTLKGMAVPAEVADGADATAAATADLLSDEDRRRTLGERARVFVETHFSPSAYARRLEDTYREGIEAKRAHRG
jgi:glycosyltransferase involved in cell wall biosynthesis